MGSGLILLVIVGAWLAVLVPMGLRPSDGTATSRSAERWSEAVRVLSRRSPAAPPSDELAYDELAYDEVPGEDEPVPDEHPPLRRLDGLRGWLPTAHELRAAPGALVRGARATLADRRTGRAQRPRRSPAARRRRVLVALVLLTVLAAAAGQVGPAWLLDVAGASAVLALLFLVSCRRAAARRSLARQAHERRAQQAAARRADDRRRAEAEHVQVVPVVAQVAGQVEVDVDVEVEVVAVPQQARPAAGAEWQPVPVPLPTYVGKATAPRRHAPVVEPDSWTPVQGGEVADDEQGVFEPRRVVSGW